FERDGHAEVGRGLVCAGLHGLPELMLEALGDERDVHVLGHCHGRAAAQKGDGAEGAENGASVKHGFLRWFVYDRNFPGALSLSSWLLARPDGCARHASSKPAAAQNVG